MPLKLTQCAISINLGNCYCKKHIYAIWFCSACASTKQRVLLLNIVWTHLMLLTHYYKSMNSTLFKWWYRQIPHHGLPTWTHPWQQKHSHQTQMQKNYQNQLHVKLCCFFQSMLQRQQFLWSSNGWWLTCSLFPHCRSEGLWHLCVPQMNFQAPLTPDPPHFETSYPRAI